MRNGFGENQRLVSGIGVGTVGAAEQTGRSMQASQWFLWFNTCTNTVIITKIIDKITKLVLYFYLFFNLFFY